MATSCVADKVVSAKINTSTITPTPATFTNGSAKSTRRDAEHASQHPQAPIAESMHQRRPKHFQ